jgi:hypothetical protein
VSGHPYHRAEPRGTRLQGRRSAHAGPGQRHRRSRVRI